MQLTLDRKMHGLVGPNRILMSNEISMIRPIKCNQAKHHAQIGVRMLAVESARGNRCCLSCMQHASRKHSLNWFKRWRTGRKDEKKRVKFMHGGRRGRATCTLEEDTNPCLPAIEKLGVPKQVHRLAPDAAHREVSKKHPKNLA
jgi:hypothetical protein